MKKFIFLMIICLAFSGCKLFEKEAEQVNVFVDTSNPTFTMGSDNTNNVPPLTNEDIFRNILDLINEGRTDDAVSGLHSLLIEDDTNRHNWWVNFNTIQKITLNSFEKSDFENVNDDVRIYKATFDILSKPQAPIVGWEEGENLRWIHIQKDKDGLWKVSAFATSP